MKYIRWGSYIRIFELTKSLKSPLIHGGKVTRLLNLVRNAPIILSAKKILIFDYWPLSYDALLFSNLLKGGTNFIFDVADIPYLQPAYFGDHESTKAESYAKAQKNFYWLVDISKILLFVSSSLVKLLDLDLKRRKTIIIPNASNPDFFEKTPIPIEKDKTILYTGGYAPMRGLDILVEAFSLLREKRKDILLRIVSPNIPYELQVNGVTIETNKFYVDMPRVYSESYLCAVPHKRNPYMEAALPIKLFDAMAAGRPVIVTNCYEMARLVEREKCGLVAEDNAGSLAQAIDILLSDRSLSEEMGEKGREAVEKRHSWHHRAQTVINSI